MLNLGQLNTIRAYINNGQFEAMDEYLSQVYGKQKVGQLDPLIIRQVGIDEYCSICKDREIYKLENLPIIKIAGSRNCHYCGNEINFCGKHWELFKRQLERLSV